jgi:hypothetical protein
VLAGTGAETTATAKRIAVPRMEGKNCMVKVGVERLGTGLATKGLFRNYLLTCWFSTWLGSVNGAPPHSPPYLSTTHKSINMDPITKAIEEIELLGPVEGWSYRKIAREHGFACTTLRRIHQGQNKPMEEQKLRRQKLNPQQELELVNYIKGLTAHCLQPTREMVQNFASSIAQQPVGLSWVTQFLNQNSEAIKSHWTTGMNQNRHQADSEDKYQLFFQLLLEKMKEYDIQPEHLYNMDEKGFLIGVIGRSKRIFSKAMWDSKEVRAALQDGNREWITLLACICGDGSALPPGLLFA